MDTTTIETSPSGHKDSFVASRNDSGWADSGSLTGDVDAGPQVVADGNPNTQFAFKWPSVNDNGIPPKSSDSRKNGDDLGLHIEPATPSSLFNRTVERSTRTSIADDCISPGTAAPTRNKLSIPNNVDVIAHARNPAALHPVQPFDKSIATVGRVQKSVVEINTTICIEESHWHRNKPQRLLSYQSLSTSSSESSEEDLPRHPNARSSGSSSSDDWMMAEEQLTPSSPEDRKSGDSSCHASGSRKSSKFITKPSLKAHERHASPHNCQRKSRDSFPSSIGRPKEVGAKGAARPLRHYSYGATLDLPPMGIQTHRDTEDCQVSENEAVIEATDLVMSATTPQTLTELQAQLDQREEPLTFLQKCMIGGLLVLANTAFLGSSVFLLLRPKVWNESRFALAAIPLTVWLCLVLQIMQHRRGRRRSRLLRSEDDGSLP